MSYQTAVQTFQCPKCREYINVSAKQCRFCASEVDSSTAAADAWLQETVAQAVNLARMARVAAWFLLAFWLNILVFYFIGTETGVFILLPVVLLISAVGSVAGWWTRYGKLQTADEDYTRARASMKTTAVLTVIMLFIPPLMFAIAWSTGILRTLNIM
jgi:predicted anti-sigma-YlaC factor YlaD